MSEAALHRRDIRILLGSIFVDTESLMAFIIDFFPDIASQCSTGMERIRIENLLMQKADLLELSVLLKSYHRQTTVQYLQQRLLVDIPGSDSGPQVIKEKSLPGEMQAELDVLRRHKEILLMHKAPTDHIDTSIRKLRADLRKLQQVTAHEILQERYRLTETISIGNLSYVWLAYDRKPSANQNKRVAIRILRNERTTDQSIVNMFMNGGSIAYSFTHQNSSEYLLKLITTPMQQKGQYYYVMEYADEKDLYHAVIDNQISTDAGIGVVIQIGQALTYLHQNSIVHRLVAPKNILLSSSSSKEALLIGKLGGYDRLARLDDDSFASFSMRMPEEIQYAPPELEDGINVLDPRADIYGLAKVLLFVIMRREISQTEKHRIDQVIAGLVASDRLRIVLQKALHPDPKYRFDSADDFCQAISSALRESSTSFPTLYSQAAEISFSSVHTNQGNANVSENRAMAQIAQLNQLDSNNLRLFHGIKRGWQLTLIVISLLSCISIFLLLIMLRYVDHERRGKHVLINELGSIKNSNLDLQHQIQAIDDRIQKKSDAECNDNKLHTMKSDLVKIQDLLKEVLVASKDTSNISKPETTTADKPVVAPKGKESNVVRMGKVCIRSEPSRVLIKYKIDGQSKTKLGKAPGFNAPKCLEVLIPMNKTTTFYGEFANCEDFSRTVTEQSEWHEEKDPPELSLKLKLTCSDEE